jgi:hypothetical protein
MGRIPAAIAWTALRCYCHRSCIDMIAVPCTPALLWLSCMPHGRPVLPCLVLSCHIPFHCMSSCTISFHPIFSHPDYQMLSSNGCACGVEEISAERMEWKGVGDREGTTSHALLGALLIIVPAHSLKVMTMSLSADGCMGGTVHNTSKHTGSF